ncbi:hypothetical protein QYE76_030342 [Lolium multiflorum]|uniref:Uncharacterized protein n=1 Tax=Lolium multiflorum TaxID=4521 RepID=A0AAD8QRD1_LOLMU|nr:hypothetical protein QYE76_030342 [Lolium multiflorum]
MGEEWSFPSADLFFETADLFFENNPDWFLHMIRRADVDQPMEEGLTLALAWEPGDLIVETDCAEAIKLVTKGCQSCPGTRCECK